MKLSPCYPLFSPSAALCPGSTSARQCRSDAPACHAHVWECPAICSPCLGSRRALLCRAAFNSSLTVTVALQLLRRVDMAITLGQHSPQSPADRSPGSTEHDIGRASRVSLAQQYSPATLDPRLGRVLISLCCGSYHYRSDAWYHRPILQVAVASSCEQPLRSEVSCAGSQVW